MSERLLVSGPIRYGLWQRGQCVGIVALRGTAVVGFVPLVPPMAMQISQPEQAWQGQMRARSYELAVQRGHVNRWPA